jgi:hypothetical protein
MRSTSCCVKSRISSDRLSLSEEQTTGVRGRRWWMRKAGRCPEREGTSESSVLVDIIAFALIKSCRYFGRAKDLPGVKELFQRGAVQETEDAARFSSFQKFRDNGDDYYGNVDEVDPELVKEEEEMEVEGTPRGCFDCRRFTHSTHRDRLGRSIRENRRTTITTRGRHTATRTGKSTSANRGRR